MKLYLLCRGENDSNRGYTVAEAVAAAVPPQGTIIDVLLYEDAGEEKFGEFRVLGIRHILVNRKHVFPHLSLPTVSPKEEEVVLSVEPVDPIARQWVDEAINQEITRGEALMKWFDETFQGQIVEKHSPP